MEKSEKRILIGVLLVLILYYFFKKNDVKTLGAPDLETDLDETGGGSSGGSGGGGSGGSGAPSTGTDSTDDQVNDPTSPFTDYVEGGGGPTAPIVGDIASGSSGKPSVGKPTQPYARKPQMGKNPVSQQRLVRGQGGPSSGSSYFK